MDAAEITPHGVAYNGLHARRRLNRTLRALLRRRRLSPGEAVWCAYSRVFPADPCGHALFSDVWCPAKPECAKDGTPSIRTRYGFPILFMGDNLYIIFPSICFISTEPKDLLSLLLDLLSPITYTYPSGMISEIF